MSMVVDWQKRAERLLSWIGRYDEGSVICDILRETERDEPDAEPVKAAQQAFYAGQWVRNVTTGTTHQVAYARDAYVWLEEGKAWLKSNMFVLIPAPVTVRAELAAIRARLDEIAAKVGAA